MKNLEDRTRGIKRVTDTDSVFCVPGSVEQHHHCLHSSRCFPVSIFRVNTLATNIVTAELIGGKVILPYRVKCWLTVWFHFISALTKFLQHSGFDVIHIVTLVVIWTVTSTRGALQIVNDVCICGLGRKYGD